MTDAEKGRVDALEQNMKEVRNDVAELKTNNELMTKRMDKMDASLTVLHKNRRQDRDILKFIASKMDKDKEFVSDNEEDADESLTPWDDVDETPQDPRSNGRHPTPTPLAQRPQTHRADGKGGDVVPETQQSPDPSRRLSISSAANTPMEIRDSRKRLPASPGVRAMKTGFIHVPPRTNVNETHEWIAYRVTILSTIDDNKWWGKLTDFSPNTPPILVENLKSCWYEDQEDSTAALAARMSGKRPRTATHAPAPTRPAGTEPS